MSVKNKSLVTIALLSLVLAACGDKSAEHKSSTQVVAKVNGDEISVHQVNLQMSRAGKLTEEQSKEVSKKVVAKLVDQQLLLQQAEKDKLDRDPQILQILEASKADILAQAYLERVASKAQKPSSAEIDAFYNEHPELFSKRRIFRLQELVVNAPKEKLEAVQLGVKDQKSINDVATWLKDNNYPFDVNSNVKPAEQLSGNMLKILQPLKDGNFIVVNTGRGLNVVNLAASQDQPITKDKATPVIEQYFLNKNKKELVSKEVETLRSQASIEYLGEFSSMKNAEKKQPEIKPEVQPLSKTNETKDSPVEAPKPTSDQSAIDKGLAGM
ncbi:MAG: EpsD family peptidyl-prolyl cis-trans isomerase [Methylophilus sp.]